MNEEISRSLPEHPIRWTYDGTMDDMVTSYPWPGIPVSDTKRSLDARLAYSVVAGTRLLLNDGCLVLNQGCFESLPYRNSPLWALINKHHVRVLSRSPARSLVEVVRDGARQGIRTYKERWDDPEWQRRALPILKAAEEDLGEKSAFVDWPRVNLGRSYHELIRRLMRLSPQELWELDRVPAVFMRVAERFDNEMSKEAGKPRTKWEEIVKEEAEAGNATKAEIDALMQLANEVYHHNFGAALTARPPANLPEGADIAVQTRVSNAFSTLYKSHALTASPATSVVPEIVLPGGVDYSTPGLLAGLLDEDFAGTCRLNYLNLRARYRAGEVSAEDMAAMRDEYQRKLDEYLRPLIPTHIARSAVSVGVSVGVGLLTGHFMGQEGGILVGVFTFLTGLGKDFAVRRIVERWRLGELERGARLKLKNLKELIFQRRVLTSLAVHPGEAKQLVGSLPALQ
jgi:hypothetical protein